jgi:CRP-like cAMP-binding protein
MGFEELVRAIQSLNTEDAFRARLDLAQWRTLGGFMTPQTVRAGEQLIQQGTVDRSVYFLAQGSLQIYVSGPKAATSRIVMLRPGALFGESGLFSDGAHTTNVEAMTACTVWALRMPRFQELSQRSPAIAMEFMRAAGGVLVTRMRAAATT